MDSLLKWLLALAPFLAPYPIWVKAVFTGWVGLSALLIVALVLARPSTTVSTSGGDSTPPPPKQRDVWMIIDGMEFFAAREGAQVRVVANVNGTEFIYPGKAGVEWLEVGPSMSAQVFHLPPAKERYILRFDASVRVPGSNQGEAWVMGQLKSVNEQIVNVTGDIPFSGRYVLHTFDPLHMARSATAEAQLLYRITFDPK